MIISAQRVSEILDALTPSFRHRIEVSASRIIAKIEPKTFKRIEQLVNLTLIEAQLEPDNNKSDIAYALAAELTRRARALR